MEKKNEFVGWVEPCETQQERMRSYLWPSKVIILPFSGSACQLLIVLTDGLCRIKIS